MCLYYFLTDLYRRIFYALFFSCSYGGAEIHSIAAFMGGIAAQEIIKLITGQYKPIQNTYIYNGCTQNSLVLDL